MRGTPAAGHLGFRSASPVPPAAEATRGPGSRVLSRRISAAERSAEVTRSTGTGESSAAACVPSLQHVPSCRSAGPPCVPGACALDLFPGRWGSGASWPRALCDRVFWDSGSWLDQAPAIDTGAGIARPAGCFPASALSSGRAERSTIATSAPVPSAEGGIGCASTGALRSVAVLRTGAAREVLSWRCIATPAPAHARMAMTRP